MQEPQPSPSNGDQAEESPDIAAEVAAPSVEQQLADLKARHAEVSDAFLRAKAEAENTRRRAEEEVSKSRKYAVDAFAESLLPVKDSLEATLARFGTLALARLTGIQALEEIAHMSNDRFAGLRLDGLLSIWHGAER